MKKYFAGSNVIAQDLISPRRTLNLELSSPLKATMTRRAIEENPLAEINHLSPDQIVLAGSGESNSNSIIITVTTHCN